MRIFCTSTYLLYIKLFIFNLRKIILPIFFQVFGFWTTHQKERYRQGNRSRQPTDANRLTSTDSDRSEVANACRTNAFLQQLALTRHLQAPDHLLPHHQLSLSLLFSTRGHQRRLARRHVDRQSFDHQNTNYCHHLTVDIVRGVRCPTKKRLAPHKLDGCRRLVHVHVPIDVGVAGVFLLVGFCSKRRPGARKPRRHWYACIHDPTVWFGGNWLVCDLLLVWPQPRKLFGPLLVGQFVVGPVLFCHVFGL